MTGADRAVRLSMAGTVIAVAGVAAWVSYRHAYDVVRAHGEDQATARMVPLTIDGLVYAASMVLLHCARHRVAVPALARVLLAVGIAATLAANVLHGAGHGPVGAVIAAWPAVALVGSYELLMWVIRSSTPDVTAVSPSGDTGPDTGADRSGQTPDTAPEADTGPDAVTAAVRLLSAEPDMTGAELGRRLGLSARQGRRVRDRALNGAPANERRHAQ